jgi:hypothetical protein
VNESQSAQLLDDVSSILARMDENDKSMATVGESSLVVPCRPSASSRTQVVVVPSKTFKVVK